MLRVNVLLSGVVVIGAVVVDVEDAVAVVVIADVAFPVVVASFWLALGTKSTVVVNVEHAVVVVVVVAGVARAVAVGVVLAWVVDAGAVV